MLEEQAPSRPDAAERRALLECLAQAFRDNPMNRALHGPDPLRRVRANRAGLRAIVLDSVLPIETWVIGTNYRVEGGLIAAPPGVWPLPSPSLRRQIGCLWHQGARTMEAWGEVNLRLMGLRPTEPTWYLAVVGVRPESQGQGVGSRLLEHFVSRVAGPAAPIYLESDRPESVSFYRARGFDVRARTTIHGVECTALGLGFADGEGDLCDPVRQA